jgi:peptidoglycan/xylan/chitin deacetylase (PgdA/CDA1 family)
MDFMYQSLAISEGSHREIPVLVYHRVGYNECSLNITPERFAQDLRQLKDHGYQTISLRQFQDYLLGRLEELPEKPILITLDDGYLDNYENAYPILRYHGMVATFFIITGMLGNTDRLDYYHILEMKNQGMSFGSHTVSHRLLERLPNTEINEELNSSRSTLENILGSPVQAVAYPSGSYNHATIKLAQDNGYINGFTVTQGICSTDSPKFELRRIPIFSYDGNIISVIAKRS